MKFSHSFRVSADDIDEQRHVNNVAFVRWIQEVAVAHWFSRTTRQQREKFTWIVIRHEIDYKNKRLKTKKSRRRPGSASRRALVGKDLPKSHAAKVCWLKPEAFGV